MKLIRELVVEDVEYLTEEVNGKKQLFIKGPFIQMDVVNANKRVYPEANINEEVKRYINDCVKTNRAFGELGHPNTPKINLDRVSHRIVELVKEGKTWVGKALISSTPCGLIARGLMEDGGQLGVSTRGVGTMSEQEGISRIQNDFKLCTAGDIVTDPSGPDCFVTALMEDREWVFTNGMWEESELVQAQRQLDQKFTIEEQLAVFEKFLGNMRIV